MKWSVGVDAGWGVTQCRGVARSFTAELERKAIASVLSHAIAESSKTEVDSENGELRWRLKHSLSLRPRYRVAPPMEMSSCCDTELSHYEPAPAGHSLTAPQPPAKPTGGQALKLCSSERLCHGPTEWPAIGGWSYDMPPVPVALVPDFWGVSRVHTWYP